MNIISCPPSSATEKVPNMTTTPCSSTHFLLDSEEDLEHGGNAERPWTVEPPETELRRVLEEHYAERVNDFGYLRCLKPVDRVAFIDQWVARLLRGSKDQAERIASIVWGKIDLCVWKSIMRSVELRYSYWVYRYASSHEKPGNSLGSTYQVLAKRFPASVQVKHPLDVYLLFTGNRLTSFPMFSGRILEGPFP
jgi:hypothetical protein